MHCIRPFRVHRNRMCERKKNSNITFGLLRTGAFRSVIYMTVRLEERTITLYTWRSCNVPFGEFKYGKNDRYEWERGRRKLPTKIALVHNANITWLQIVHILVYIYLRWLVLWKPLPHTCTRICVICNV